MGNLVRQVGVIPQLQLSNFLLSVTKNVSSDWNKDKLRLSWGTSGCQLSVSMQFYSIIGDSNYGHIFLGEVPPQSLAFSIHLAV